MASSAHRNAGPAAYHVGNIVGSYLFLYYGIAALVFLQFLLHAEYLVVKGFYLSVTYFGHLAVIAGAFGLVGLETQLLYLQFVLLYLAEQFLFGLPFGAEVGSLLLKFCYLLVQLLEFRLVVLALYRLALYFELLFVARYLVKFLGH